MVTSSTWGRRALFHAEPWAKLFLDNLYHYRPAAYSLHAFVLVPDHFHVLITPETSLERAVQCIKGGFSHRAKAELGSNMEIWQKGFSDPRIRDAADYDLHVAYMRGNPVRKRLCQSPDTYPYSSAYAEFALDPAPRRLKPLVAAAACGAAEAAPFQNMSRSSYLSTNTKQDCVKDARAVSGARYK
jgi:putative transposase